MYKMGIRYFKAIIVQKKHTEKADNIWSYRFNFVILPKRLQKCYKLIILTIYGKQRRQQKGRDLD